MGNMTQLDIYMIIFTRISYHFRRTFLWKGEDLDAKRIPLINWGCDWGTLKNTKLFIWGWYMDRSQKEVLIPNLDQYKRLILK